MIFGAASALLLAMVSAASATATFSVTATSKLEFEFPGFTFDSIINDNNFGSVFGGATVSKALSPDGVLPATLAASAAGSASASVAGATAITSHLITMGLGDGSGPVPFTFTYNWDVAVAVDDPTLERALGGVTFLIRDDSGFEPKPAPCLIDGTFSDCRFILTADTDLGQTGTAGSATVTGLFIVGFGQIDEFTVLTDIQGLALSAAQVEAVPEPATLALLGVGLLGLGLRRRCRRSAVSSSCR